MKKKIISIIIFSFSLILSVYTVYKSEFIWSGENRDYYYTYYLLGISLLLFSGIIFFIDLNEKIITYFIIIFVCSLFSFYAAEAYLVYNKSSFKKDRLYEKNLNIKSKRYKIEYGKDFDRRSQNEVYKDLKKNEKKTAISLFPNHYLKKKKIKIFPLSGISNSKTITCNENGYYANYLSDRYGFNNPDSEWDKKDIGYFLIGDSFTHGACVDRPNDIASVLRKLSQRSVLNLGYGANGPLIEYATLREYMSPKIKKIIWLYYEGNDIVDLNRELKSSILSKYIDNKNFSQNLKNKQKEIDLMSEKLIISFVKKDNKKKFKIVDFMKLSKVRVTLNKLLPKKYQPKVKHAPSIKFKEILDSAKKLSEKNDSNFYFVYLPEYARYNKNYENPNYLLIKKIVNDLGIPFIDINNEVFKKEQNPLKLFPFEMHAHYNKKGYSKVAEVIYKLTSQ